jgi:hypothetical protein
MSLLLPLLSAVIRCYPLLCRCYAAVMPLLFPLLFEKKTLNINELTKITFFFARVRHRGGKDRVARVPPGRKLRLPRQPNRASLASASDRMG